MFKLKGVIPPMITPFQEDGTLDEKSLIHLVEYLSERVDGLFICGSYGCGALMTIEERKRVAEIVKKYARKDLTIVVHTGTQHHRNDRTDPSCAGYRLRRSVFRRSLLL